MTTKAVRIAVAGAGMIGRRHAAIIRVTPDCILSAIVDPAPAAADFAHTLGVPLFGSLAELLAVARPDGVVLATPNPLHVEQALAAGVAADRRERLGRAPVGAGLSGLLAQAVEYRRHDEHIDAQLAGT